ncbi:MAG: class I SAM-dependent methyltransferase [Candidatus Woesearchaeota archaeon]
MKKTNNKCRLCKSENLKIIKKEREFRLMKCNDCGIIFLDPFPNHFKLRRMYSIDKTKNFEYYKLSEPLDKISFDSELKIITKHIPKKNGKIKILDYGCSNGTFMEVAREHGFEVEGREINKNSIKTSRHKGFIVNSNHKNFDIVTAHELIEHLSDPIKFINEVKNLLKKNGLPIISTPDFDKSIVRATQIKPDEHLYYFKKEVLKKILEKNGFQVLYMKNISRKRSVRALLYSTTSKKKQIKKLLKLICFLKLESATNFLLSHLKINILVIAKRIV